MPTVLGFFLPMVFLLRLLGQAETHMDWLRFFTWVQHSVLLGGMAAICALALATGLSYARRNTPKLWIRVVHHAVSLGYGIPGAIIAIAILIPLANIDRWVVDAVGKGFFPILTGSVFALLYAYCVRFTSAALQSVDTGLQRVTPHIDDSARVLGCTPRQVWWRVHFPMLRGSMATGALLVFVDVMKELPTTLVLRPFDFDTLAVVTYQFAADERLAEAAGPALSIVLVSLLPMFLLIGQTMRGGRKH
jgi:iron(III) transport system permease protein